ncbi:hypothetical protein YC2023_005405 [Brassica napus]
MTKEEHKYRWSRAKRKPNEVKCEHGTWGGIFKLAVGLHSAKKHVSHLQVYAQANWLLGYFGPCGWQGMTIYVFNNKEATPEMIITKAVAAARERLTEQNPTKGPHAATHHP